MEQVYEILWDDPPLDIWTYVRALMLAAFLGYTNPIGAGANEQRVSLILITPAQCEWNSQGVACNRTQVPSQLAFAITIHESKAITLDRVYFLLGGREFV